MTTVLSHYHIKLIIHWSPLFSSPFPT